MSISSLVLELWQFLFIRDSLEIRKLEKPSSEFWILQNGRVTAFTVSELLRENQQGGKITPLPPTQIGVKGYLA